MLGREVLVNVPYPPRNRVDAADSKLFTARDKSVKFSYRMERARYGFPLSTGVGSRNPHSFNIMWMRSLPFVAFQ
jgi:hypothetical protein